MKKGFIKLVAAALAGICLLSGCNSLPNGSNGPVEVPTTIKADFTQKEKKGNWIKYGDCKVTLKRDGKKVIMTTENGGIFLKCTTTVRTDDDDIYVALTGDQIALTKIFFK